MSNDSFNELSSFRSLKKDLDEKGTAPAPSRTQDEPSSVNLKSKDDEPGEEKGKEIGLQPGMHATVTDPNGRGAIRHVRKDCLVIELGCGLNVPAVRHGFKVNDAEEDSRLCRSFNSSKNRTAEGGSRHSSGELLRLTFTSMPFPGTGCYQRAGTAVSTVLFQESYALPSQASRQADSLCPRSWRRNPQSRHLWKNLIPPLPSHVHGHPTVTERRR